MKMKRLQIAAMLAAAAFLVNGCGNGAASQPEMQETKAETASDQETVSPSEVVEEGMVPIYGTDLKDGVYGVTVDSSSSMFRIESCSLTVKNGSMTAVMTMGGTGYLKLYMGTGEEAAKASEEQYIPYKEDGNGAHTFEIPVEALDMGIECSAFSKNKEKWYDRTLVFRADSLPADAFAEEKFVTAESLGLEDGLYTAEVVLEGGSGRAAVESPAAIRIENGKIYGTIVWGSANYDYMKVKDEKIEWKGTEGNSTFEIPVDGFDWKIPVIADTIAMSTPHEISYTLTFQSSSLKKMESGPRKEETVSQQDVSWDSMTRIGSMELRYANQFSVDYYRNPPPSGGINSGMPNAPDGVSWCGGASAGGRMQVYYEGDYAFITIQDTGKFLVVPEGGLVPKGVPGDVAVLKQPITDIYLTATSAMDLFRALDGLDRVTLSGTAASGWYIDEAKEAMDNGKMVYAGKYNAPDYELILSRSCGLAIESTMIYHNPEVKEQLEHLGIPVLVERSSYESHPLGRMEWIKLYGVLLGKEKQAETCFEDQIRQLEPVLEQEKTGKTAAFFYITSNGAVNVRKSGDYVAKMIDLAGGVYVPQGLSEEENALSTMNMQMEAFYAAAKDADYLIYNSTIDGELNSLEELLAKSSLLADFKAVKDGHVWCTGKNLFQESMGLGDMILDIHRILTEEDPAPEMMTYLHPLR